MPPSAGAFLFSGLCSVAIIFAHGGGRGPSHSRLEQAARWLEAHGTEAEIVRPRDRVERGLLRRLTVFVMHMASGEEAKEQVLGLKRRGVRCVYDLDDSWGTQGPEVLARMVDIIRVCDGVTVSTEALRERIAAEAVVRVHVIPNGLPDETGPLWAEALLWR